MPSSFACLSRAVIGTICSSAQTGRRRDAEKGKVRDSDMNSACKSLIGFIAHVLVPALMVQRKSLELKGGGAVVVQVRTSLSNRLHWQDTREYSLYSVFVQWRYRHHLGRYALSVRCCDVRLHPGVILYLAKLCLQHHSASLTIRRHKIHMYMLL